MTKTNALESLVIAGYVRGLSTRDVEASLADALGPEATLSKSTASHIYAAIRDEFDAWRRRDLFDVELEYLYLDGSEFRYHDGARAEPVLCAWGITTTGAPVFLALDGASSESHDARSTWGIAEAALAQFHMSRGDTEGVHDLIGASLERLAEARHIASTILTLEVIAELGMHHGLPRASVEVLGATAGIRSSMGTHGPPQAAQRPPQLIEHGRRDLGAGFTAAFEHGSTMTYGEAVEHGRSLLSDLRQAAE